MCEECIRDMAQFKEYSANDFLYSGYDTQLIGDYDCNKTDVQWDELIQEKCHTFTTGTAINLTINGKSYTVTTDNTINTDNAINAINTIKEIAGEFTKQTPYNFSYKSSYNYPGNYLIIDAAKITFNGTTTTTTAKGFLGYKEDDSAHNKLPFTLPDGIKNTAPTDTSSSDAFFDLSYNFNNTYMIKTNLNKTTDIRGILNEEDKVKFYNDMSLTSGKVTTTDVAYTNNLKLIQHLNKIKVGYIDSETSNASNIGNIGKCFYKFDYDYRKESSGNIKESLIVSDLILYDTLTTDTDTNTITFTVKNTVLTGAGEVTYTDASYNYKITRPENSDTKAQSVNDVVLDVGVFRKFDSVSDTTPAAGDIPLKNNKQKIISPKVRQVYTNTKTNDVTYGNYITGTYSNGIFVCELYNPTLSDEFNNKDLPTFRIAFDSTTGDPIDSTTGDPILMCSGSKYVKIGNDYYTLPYTKKIENDTSATTLCETVNQNKSLCDNKKSAETIMDKTQKHPGFDQQYIDAKGFSDMSVLNIINLGIGIIAAVYFIAKTYK